MSEIISTIDRQTVETTAAPATAPQIIDVPAIVTARTRSYVPDTVHEIDDIVRRSAEYHGVPIDSAKTTGSSGLWAHTYRTGVTIGATSVMTLAILASDNRRRSLMIIVGKETLVCANGMIRTVRHHEQATRHTLHVRYRAEQMIGNAFARIYGIARDYAAHENRLRSIEFRAKEMAEENYRAIIAEAWSADTARAIHREIINPTYADFGEENLYAYQERVTTALRTLVDRPQAWRAAAMHLDRRITYLSSLRAPTGSGY